MPTPLCAKEALPWILSSIRRLGRRAGESLDFLIALAESCVSTVWAGPPGPSSAIRVFENTVSPREPAAGRPDVSQPSTLPKVRRKEPPAHEICVRTAADLLVRRVDTGWFVVNPAVGQPVVLDAQAAVLLHLLDGRNRLSDIVGVAADVFPEDAATIEARLRELIRMFALHGFIKNARTDQRESPASNQQMPVQV